MTAQTMTPDIAAADVAGTGKGAGAPTLPPGGHQPVDRTTLTCTWVTTDDGALVMQWTAQTPEEAREEMTRAAA